MNYQELMDKAKVLMLAVIAFLLTVSTGGATIYYVDKNHSDASDSNPGTEQLPWLTIQKAADTLVAGDTVYVKNGTYSESINPVNSGTDGNYITYQAYPGDSPIIQPNGNGFYLDNGEDYIKINGFEISGGSFGIHASDTSVTSNYIIISNNYIHDQAASEISAGIWGRTIRNWTINNNTISGTGYRELWLEGDIYTLVENNAFLGHIGEDNTFFGGSESIIIRGNYFSGPSGGTGHDDSIQLECTKDVLIENNVFTNTNNLDIDAQTGSCTNGGPYLNNTRIIGNVFKNIGGYTVALKEGSFEIKNNTFAESTIGALWIRNDFDDRNPTLGTIKNNIFYNNDQPNEIYRQADQDIDYNLYYLNGNLDDNEDSGAHSFIHSPLFIDPNDVPGSDNIYWTSDDGLNLQTTEAGFPQNSIACGKGQGGSDIGAYSCVFVVPSSPNNLQLN